MNKWIITACALSSLTVVAHIIGGEVTVHQPLLAAGIGPELQAYVSILWHFASAALIINSFVLFYALRETHRKRAAVYIVIAQYTAFTALFAFYGIYRLGTLWIAPQWVIFAAIVATAALGLRSAGREAK